MAPATRSARARRQKLRNGDRIKFGLYEIEVMIDEDEEGAARDHEGSLSGLRRDDFAMRDALPSRADLGHYDDAGNDARLPESRSVLDVSNTPILPADFDPLAPHQEPFAGHATGPCARARERLPPAPAGGHHSRRLGCRSACRLAPRRPARPPPPPRPVEVRSPRAGTKAGPAAAPAGGTPTPDWRRPFCAASGSTEAVLRIRKKPSSGLGAATRATVSGLRQTLMARASIKDEFRIEQTMIRASGNNPLKFSLDDDDALATLLGTGRRTGMGAGGGDCRSLR